MTNSTLASKIPPSVVPKVKHYFNKSNTTYAKLPLRQSPQVRGGQEIPFRDFGGNLVRPHVWLLDCSRGVAGNF